MDPGAFNLPAIFDPIFIYLEDNLPPPLYNFLLNFLSHCLAVLSALVNVATSLLSKNPLEWDTQTVLPPLITLLAAYLALLSLYRTTTWMIRTTFWFMKWGVILGSLAAGVGWYMGVSRTQGSGLMNASVISYLGNVAMDMINGKNQNAMGGDRAQQTGRKASKRPKPWESFNRHQEWQYREDQTEGGETSDLETLFDNLMGAAGQLMKDNWWTGMKDMMGQSRQAPEEDSRQSQRKRGSKSNSR